MPRDVTRPEAIEAIATNEMSQLSLQEKFDTLLDAWPIDSDDPEFEFLPLDLREELASTDAPCHPADDGRYRPLVMMALRHRLNQFRNEYLTARLHALGMIVRVVGAEQRLVECPCCRFRTLETRGDLQVCAVCMWEDDGFDEVDRYSGPNHMTLREAQENVRMHGVVAPDFKSSVPNDARERYHAGNEGKGDTGERDE